MKTRIVFLLFFYTLLSAQTLINGSVSGTWTARDNPYQLNGNAVVNAGDTLIIADGVLLDMGGQYELRVAGTLLAEGVRFQEGGRIFGNNGLLEMSHCICNGLSGGVQVYGGQASITACLVDSTQDTGITFSGTDSSEISNSQVLNSGGYGIKISQTDAVSISGNHHIGTRNSCDFPVSFIP